MPDIAEFIEGLSSIENGIASSAEDFLREEMEQIVESAKAKVPRHSKVGQTIKAEVAPYSGDSITGEITAGGSTPAGQKTRSAVADHEDTSKGIDQDGRGPKFITRAIDEQVGELQGESLQMADRQAARGNPEEAEDHPTSNIG